LRPDWQVGIGNSNSSDSGRYNS